MNVVWAGMILIAVVWGGLTGRMDQVTAAIFTSATAAVSLVIGLVGIMVFLLGAMHVAFDGGLRDAIARRLAPLLRRLFPDVPEDHPAMSAMVMNMSSNMAGLGNAATPFGLKAMAELDQLNEHRGSATNAMVLFLAINTSAITLLPPLGTIAVRVAAGSAHPEAIWVPTLFATTCSTLAAVGAFFLLRDLPIFRTRHSSSEIAQPSTAPEVEIPVARAVSGEGSEPWRRWAVRITLLALFAGLAVEVHRLSASLDAGALLRTLLQTWLFPSLLVALVLIGIRGGVRVYESMVAGAREGLEVAFRIVPYLVAILVAVGMFRASGALDLLIGLLDPLTSRIGVPAAALPMALLRPLSGSGAFAVMSETLTTHGPDSFVGYLVSTLQGSTETTFYVLALYLGAAGVRDGRHALACCLIGDLAGFFGAVVACHVFFG